MTDAPRPLPPKKEVALALLEREPSVFIHLDPRRPGVVVPKWLANQPQLVLQIGMNMTISIPDLKVDEEGISCTLSFQRTPIWCRLPWGAIWAMVGESQRGMVWPDDVPPEVAAQQQQKGAAAAQKEKPKKPRPRLAAVGSADRSEPEAEAAQPEAEAGPAEAAPEAGPAPAPAPAPAAAPVAAPAAAPAAAAGEEQPEAGEGGAASPAARPGGKPKRELPPYLRVIK